MKIEGLEVERAADRQAKRERLADLFRDNQGHFRGDATSIGMEIAEFLYAPAKSQSPHEYTQVTESIAKAATEANCWLLTPSQQEVDMAGSHQQAVIDALTATYLAGPPLYRNGQVLAS